MSAVLSVTTSGPAPSYHKDADGEGSEAPCVGLALGNRLHHPAGPLEQLRR